MKFGAVIKGALYQDWQENYVDYAGLKRYLKDNTPGWDDSAEAGFISILEKELDKVVVFQEHKIQELTTQISEYENQVKELVAERQEAKEAKKASCVPAEDEEQPVNPEAVDNYDENSEASDNEATEDQFVELEEDLANVIADVHDLGHFSHLNYTGFIKIVKKHDKKTGFVLKTQFMRDYLEKRPFYKENYDALIVQLSRLYNLVRTRGNPIIGDSSAGGSQNAFVRQTTKYWVHPDNYVQLKLVILKHLPVLVFDADKPFEPADAAITSIYFDNEDFDLYLGRLEKSEGAEAVRFRWYGGMGVKTIFVERKTHREDWTGEKSVKARFPIPESKMNEFLAGTYTMDNTFEKMRKSGKKSDKEIDAMLKLASEVQAAIKIKKLQPVVRTFYNRTAFQLPGDARVRISFDTQLTMVREDNWDGVQRSGDNWRRMDIGIDTPFDLPASEQEVFPYGVLEVKLQTQLGQEPPEWVRELVSSHLVEAVPKFSKFIHGCATLYPNRVQLIPFWLPQMETDIRKPATQKASIVRPSHSHSTNTQSPHSGGSDVATDPQHYTEPVSDDEGDAEENRHVKVTSDEAGWTALTTKQTEDLRKVREDNIKREEEEESRSQALASGALTIAQEVFPKLTPTNLAKLLETKLGKSQDEEENDATNEIGIVSKVDYVSSFRAPTGKRIIVPVRVEPKVYYANERTMLHWMEFSVVISGVGIGIISFADPHDDIALVASVCFTAIALLTLLYTAYRYAWRVFKIRNREAVNYHDWFGPSALCVVILLAVIVNFSLQIKAGF